MTHATEDDRLVAVRYRVSAEAEPGLLPRLLAPLARRDLVPEALRAWREGEVLHAELWLAAMPAGMVHLVAGNLGQVVGVRDVRTEREDPAAAPPKTDRDAGAAVLREAA